MVNSNFLPYILYAPFPYVIITKSKHKYCFYDSPLSIHSLIQIIIIFFNDLIIIIIFFFLIFGKYACRELLSYCNSIFMSSYCIFGLNVLPREGSWHMALIHKYIRRSI